MGDKFILIHKEDTVLSKLYRMSNELKFISIADSMDYVSHFNIVKEVYQVKDPTRCRLLATTLYYGKIDCIGSGKDMGKLFITRFRAYVAFALWTNGLGNIKQRDNDILIKYINRFNAEVPILRKTSKETLKNL